MHGEGALTATLQIVSKPLGNETSHRANRRLWVLAVLGGVLLSLCVVTAYQLTADSSAFVLSHSGLTCRAKDQFLPGYVVVVAHSNGNHQAGRGCDCSDGRDGCGNPIQVCEKT